MKKKNKQIQTEMSYKVIQSRLIPLYYGVMY